MTFRALLLVIVLVGGVRAAGAQPAAAPDAVAYVALDSTQMRQQDCGPRARPGDVCRLHRPWTEATLRARWQQAGASAWFDDGDAVTFVYEGTARGVNVCCGVQLPLSPLAGTNLWVLTVRLPRAREAAFSYLFIPDTGVPFAPGHRFEWSTLRGPEAPAAVEKVAEVRGTLQVDSLWSDAMGMRRAVTVYAPPGHTPAERLPVVYFGDGQDVAAYARVVEPAMLAGRLPRVLLVGDHTPIATVRSTDPRDDPRGQEYLLGFIDGDARFLAHERFVLDELLPWAERTWGASARPAERAIGGKSNAGAYAIVMGLRHPDVFGHVLGFSAGWRHGHVYADGGPRARFFLLAGTLESSFHTSVSTTTGELRTHGYDVVMKERVAGHDPLMWEEMVPEAIGWAFGTPASEAARMRAGER